MLCVDRMIRAKEVGGPKPRDMEAADMSFVYGNRMNKFHCEQYIIYIWSIMYIIYHLRLEVYSWEALRVSLPAGTISGAPRQDWDDAGLR